MYYLLSILSGFLIAAMVAVNGYLTTWHGTYLATVIIHFVGLVFVFLFIKLKKGRIFGSHKRLPYYCYLGGAIGVITTVCNNIGFGKISVSAILALGLLGQSITAIVIDHFGLFHMKVQKFNPKKLIGYAFVLIGIVFLMDL
ncbi:possible membrane-spanning protein [Lachnospiraceae bacterium KM106-2]|nr:possible membrane-spanning protein [Lachnospiraceae bacterium KM106-2]